MRSDGLCAIGRKGSQPRFRRPSAIVKATLSPAAKAFLRDVSQSTQRAISDEIAEIKRAPEDRGSIYEESDPEFRDMRIGLGVAGFAIFYVHYQAVGEIYIVTIRPWDFPDLP